MYTQISHRIINHAPVYSSIYGSHPDVHRKARGSAIREARPCRHALRDVETVWAVRNQHIGDAFFDVDAARFLLQHLQSTAQKVVSGPDTSAATTAVLDSKERKLDPSVSFPRDMSTSVC